MNDMIFKTKNHKKEKIIVILVIILCIIMISLFSYLFYLGLKNRPLIEYPKYSLSTTEWTNDSVIIEVETEEGKIQAYSFDGGKSYQEENKYEVLANQEVFLMVKDINGRESKIIPISIKNVDKEPPVIIVESITTVQLGSNFSLRSGVNVYDMESGLNSNYVITPDSIDTSVAGEYVIHYTVFDKAGNYTEKERKIVVTDINGRTYYRYRKATTETYQCEPSMCNCVTSEAIKNSLTCPAGYTFTEPNQCCQTCYKTCTKTTWSEWSEWSQEKITATANIEVETKIE